MLTLWPERPAVKVRPSTPAPAQAGQPLTVKGFRGEGLAGQVVLRSDATLVDVTPSISPFINASGAVLPESAVALYRVGYIDITTRSDPAGDLGEWPDPLCPIGKDRYYAEDRNSARRDYESTRPARASAPTRRPGRARHPGTGPAPRRGCGERLHFGCGPPPHPITCGPTRSA